MKRALTFLESCRGSVDKKRTSHLLSSSFWVASVVPVIPQSEVLANILQEMCEECSAKCWQNVSQILVLQLGVK